MVSPRTAVSRLIERRRRTYVLQHRVGSRRAPTTTHLVVPEKEATDEDVAIAQRLLNAFRAAKESGGEAAGMERVDLWTAIYQEQGRFASILDRGDPAELAPYLCNASRYDATHGIVQGDKEYERIRRDASYRRYVALMARDKIVSLAEALGVLAIENPEQGAFGESIRRDPGELVDQIADRIGIDITPPDIDGGLLKLDTGRGLFGERDANAIYTAHLLASFLNAQARPDVCEIGGGSGRVAYWSNRLGLTSYTIVDLPHVNVVQGYYLLKALPADRVTLFAESAEGRAGKGIRILPNHAISSLDGDHFDLVLNQDSFPEMNAATVVDYLSWIKTSRHRQLMSINHESRPPYGHRLVHVSVPEAVASVGGFNLCQRFPFWLRKGYAVELYSVGA